ncbi:MAG TPA: NAD(P)H-dependent glycerol-3-phosphate dehydrogenase, partial [Actinomycetota bacterium]|nr:NAD(P)H-dependent glycerol-3-phosphate dehydrogenase [Actinomycetota bacterium]
PEVAEGQPCVAVLASEHAEALRLAAERFERDAYRVETTDDCTGLEFCGTAKNVGAIGSGIVEGLGEQRDQEYRNARSVVFARATVEMADLVVAVGGRRETALGLAGVGDLLVTSLGGRNRQYGRAIGEGATPTHALAAMEGRGMTVEGVDSARDVHELARRGGLDLPVHEAVYRVVHESAEPSSILEVVR